MTTIKGNGKETAIIRHRFCVLLANACGTLMLGASVVLAPTAAAEGSHCRDPGGCAQLSPSAGRSIATLYSAELLVAPQVTVFKAGITSPPSSITTGPDGNLWFTEDDRVGRMTPTGVVTEFTSGITPGLNGAVPTAITAGPDGSVWLAELGFAFRHNQSRIARISPQGSVVDVLSRGADANDITSGPDGNLWFTQSSAYSSAVGRLTPDGHVTMFYDGIPAYAGINQITGASDGNVWFTGEGDLVGRITPAGIASVFSSGISPRSSPFGIASGPDGNIWFTERDGSRIGRITPSGTVTEFSAGISAGAWPLGITAGPDGNLWFAEWGVNKIGRITPDGIVTEFDTGIKAGAHQRVHPQSIVQGPDGNLWFAYIVIAGEDLVPFDAITSTIDGGIGRITTGARVPAPLFARLEVVSGDRQIAVNSRIPAEPFVVRALDAGGRPVAGVPLIIGPTVPFVGPMLVDEFGFRGFNAPVVNAYTAFGKPNPQYLAVTDSNGMASATGTYWDSAPSAFVVGARQWPGPSDEQAFFSVVATRMPPAGNPGVVVEYFNQTDGHYFNTLLQSEITALDAGMFAGWVRSTGAFIAYEKQEDGPDGAVSVCRFFSARYTSHFYTADQAECQAVIDRWPDVWTLETRAAFFIFEPDKTTGRCAAGLQPVYRLYSTRNGPNHRYVTDRSLRDAMVAVGWAKEGYGPDAVTLCTPS